MSPSYYVLQVPARINLSDFECNIDTVHQLLQETADREPTNKLEKPFILQALFNKCQQLLLSQHHVYQGDVIRDELLGYILARPDSLEEKCEQLTQFDELNKNIALSRLSKHLAAPRDQNSARLECLNWTTRRYTTISEVLNAGIYFERLFCELVSRTGIEEPGLPFDSTNFFRSAGIGNRESLRQKINGWLLQDGTPNSRLLLLHHISCLMGKLSALYKIAAEDQTFIATWSTSGKDYDCASKRARQCLLETRELFQRIKYLGGWEGRIRQDWERPHDFKDLTHSDSTLLNFMRSLPLQHISAPNPESIFKSRTDWSAEAWSAWQTSHASIDSSLHTLQDTHPGRLANASSKNRHDYHQKCVELYKTRVSKAWELSLLMQLKPASGAVFTFVHQKNFHDVIDQLLIDCHHLFMHNRRLGKLVSGMILSHRKPDTDLSLDTLLFEMKRYLRHAEFLQTTQCEVLKFLDFHHLLSNDPIEPLLSNSVDSTWMAFLNRPFMSCHAYLAIGNLWADRAFLEYEVTESLIAAEDRLDLICLAFVKSNSDCRENFEGLLEHVEKIRNDMPKHFEIFKKSLSNAKNTFDIATKHETSTDRAALKDLQLRINHFSFLGENPQLLSLWSESSFEALAMRSKAAGMDQKNLKDFIIYFKNIASKSPEPVFNFANSEIIFGGIYNNEITRGQRAIQSKLKEAFWAILQLHIKNGWKHMAGTAGLNFQFAHRLSRSMLENTSKKRQEDFLNPQRGNSSTQQLLREIADLSRWPQLKLMHSLLTQNTQDFPHRYEKAHEKDFSTFASLREYRKSVEKLFAAVTSFTADQNPDSYSNIRGGISLRHALMNFENLGVIVRFMQRIIAERNVDVKKMIDMKSWSNENYQCVGNQPKMNWLKLNLESFLESLQKDFEIQADEVNDAACLYESINKKMTSTKRLLSSDSEIDCGLNPNDIFSLWHYVLKSDYLACEPPAADISASSSSAHIGISLDILTPRKPSSASWKFVMNPNYPPVLQTAVETLLRPAATNSGPTIFSENNVGDILQNIAQALKDKLKKMNSEDKFSALNQLQNYLQKRAVDTERFPTSLDRLVLPVFGEKPPGPVFLPN